MKPFHIVSLDNPNLAYNRNQENEYSKSMQNKGCDYSNDNNMNTYS